jgi:hypothetical protein
VAAENAEVLLPPQVADPMPAPHPKFGPPYRDTAFPRSRIEETDAEVTAFQFLDQHFAPIDLDLVGLFAERVLVECKRQSNPSGQASSLVMQ